MRQLLVLLACPAMMVAMMLMMRRGSHGPDDRETARLQDEAAELRRALQDRNVGTDKQ